MLIKHQIVAWFTVFVSLILLLFSVYVYLSFKQYRQRSIVERLERRALSTRQLFTNDGRIQGSITNTLPEQVDLIFSGNDSLVYSNSPKYDFYPAPSLLDSARRMEKLNFAYPTANHAYFKDAVAVTYMPAFANKGEKPFVAIVTAYDLEGYTRLYSLRDLFIYGNIAFILLIAALAYLFAGRVLQPLNSLIRQIRGLQHASMSFRLKHFNPRDEIGILALAFNDLLEQQERLIANQRAFISQASHELRTPMSSLKGLLETSVLYDNEKDALVRSMQQATQELDRLVSLSNGLLQLARIENEEDFIHTHRVDLMELSMDCVEAVQAAWPEQAISLEISDGVYQQTKPLIISGESTLLKVAVNNLIDNACKYSNGNPVRVTLEMDTEYKVRLCIADRGIGIPEQDMDRIFMPLIRGSNAQTISGFGIGLTLAQKIIQLHKGRLDIRSEAGTGTAITIGFDLVGE